MGIFDKLAFWKKDKELDFDRLAEKELNRGVGADGMPLQDDFGLEEKSPFGEKATEFGKGTDPFSSSEKSGLRLGSQTGAAPAPPYPEGARDLELISSKLDTIKALLNSLDQRVANLERNALEKKKEPKLW